VQFSSRSWAEYLDMKAHDAKLFDKINALIEECRRHPFKGTGKPEPLGGNLSGWGRGGSAMSIGWCIASPAAGQTRRCRWRNAAIIIEPARCSARITG
jgi:hypothetical protein